MAYSVHFRFQFDSVGKNFYRIDILEDGYSGSIVSRHLGGSPHLRREKNGDICGTSLDFFAEAAIDGEMAVLYTSNAQGFRVDLYANNTLIWQGYITPELYSEPYIAVPYDVRVTATDNLGELKLLDYAAQGSVTIATLLSGILSKTGLSFPIHWLSAMHPSEAADVNPEDMAASTVINLDHMEGQSLYDVLQTTLGTFHAFILQYNCQWLIVRETDLEYLRNGDTIEAPDGSEFTIGDFGSMDDEVWWPVGYLSQTVVPAKREKVITAPNNWIKNILPDSATSLTNGQYVAPTNGDTPYYELTPWNSSLQYSAASAAFWSPFAEWVPVCDLKLSLLISTFGVLAGHTYGKKCADVEVKIVASDGNSYIYRWIDAEGKMSTSAVKCLEINGIARETPEQFDVPVPVFSLMSSAGYTKIYQIQVAISSTNEEDAISRMRIYDWYLNAPEQNKGYQVKCLLDNAARGASESVEIAAADNTNKAYEQLLITNGFKFGSAVSGHQGESIEEWASGNILTMPLLEFLARDYCLSIATPRLRMEGIINVPYNVPLPLLFRGGGLIYWPETFDWDLERDDITNLSMLSLPAAAIQVTSVTRSAEGSGGFAIGNKYGGSGGGIDLGVVWQSLTNNPADEYENTKIAVAHIPDITTSKITDLSSWTGSSAITTLGTVTTGTWHGNTIGIAYGGTGMTQPNVERGVMISTSGYGMTFLSPNTTNGVRKYLSQVGRGSLTPDTPEWVELSFPAATNDAIGGFKTGYSGAGAKYYGVQLNNSNQAYVYVPWTDNNTTYGLTLNGTQKGDSTGTDLGSFYAPTTAGTSGNVLTSSGSGAPSWSSSLTLSGLTVNGATVINNTLQIGSTNYNYNMQLYGELHFNGSSTAYINYTAANGIRSSENFLVGTSGSPKTLTVYGASTLVGALSVGGNIGSDGNITAAGYLRADGAVYIGGGTQYINYVSANNGLHTNVGFYSDKYLVGFQNMSASDKRLKANLRDVQLSVSQIAAAPAVTFDWADRTRGRGAGSIAQYWQRLLPENVHSFGEGWLSMEYGNIALVSSIILARKVQELEKQIEDLKRRVAA